MARKYTKTEWTSSMRDMLYDLLRTRGKSKSRKKDYQFTYGLTDKQYNAVRRQARAIWKK